MVQQVQEVIVAKKVMMVQLECRAQEGAMVQLVQEDGVVLLVKMVQLDQKVKLDAGVKLGQEAQEAHGAILVLRVLQVVEELKV